MTTNYVIEKNVPFKETMGRPAKYPFFEMEIGDSFLVVDAAPSKVSSAAGAAGKVLGRTFKTRAAEGGVRVWRVE